MVDIDSFVLGVITAVPAYVGLFVTFRRGKLQFELERFQERSSHPVQSTWSIRIKGPTRAIEHCSVLLDTYPLTVWNRSEGVNETKVEKDGGVNFRIPNNLSPFGVIKPAQITVKDGKKVLRRRKFLDIPEV